MGQTWGMVVANPNHYSLELPQRCLRLIDELWPHVQQVYEPNGTKEGPLTSTFLLAMAMPMIILPIERLERQSSKNEGYADDLHLDPSLSASVKSGLGATPFAQSPFFTPGAWSYVHWLDPSLNISRGLDDELTAQLSASESYRDAADMPASQWCSVLRNALSHGGVAYLDAQGRSARGAQADMFCFVSGKYGGPKRDVLESLRCLRIKEADFRDFLRRWGNWLKRSGVANLMAA